jgi:hypothetical protein
MRKPKVFLKARHWLLEVKNGTLLIKTAIKYALRRKDVIFAVLKTD